MQKLRDRKSHQQFELFVSNILISGVLIASTLVLVGGILYLLKHGAEIPNYKFFRGTPKEFSTPVGVIDSIFVGRYRAIIQLGIILMIATPIVRVIFSLVSFIRQKDLTYVIITAIVLLGLLYSLIV